MGCYVKHINYGAYDAPLAVTAGETKPDVGAGQRKTTRPERFRRAGREIGRAASFSSGSTADLHRRFGGKHAPAGRRTPTFSVAFAGSGFILRATSEAGATVDVSYLTFLVTTAFSGRASARHLREIPT